jgi:hypothetical protein
MSIAGQCDENPHILSPQLLFEPYSLLSMPVRACLHLSTRYPDEFEAPRSGKNAKTVAELGG